MNRFNCMKDHAVGPTLKELIPEFAICEINWRSVQSYPRDPSVIKFLVENVSKSQN